MKYEGGGSWSIAMNKMKIHLLSNNRHNVKLISISSSIQKHRDFDQIWRKKVNVHLTCQVPILDPDRLSSLKWGKENFVGLKTACFNFSKWQGRCKSTLGNWQRQFGTSLIPSSKEHFPWFLVVGRSSTWPLLMTSTYSKLGRGLLRQWGLQKWSMK